MHGVAVCLLLSVFCVFVAQTGAQIWRGNWERFQVLRSYEDRYCICWYRWWGCSEWRWRTVYYYQTIERCQVGWTDQNGDRNCNVPVCNPECANGGTCSKPNTCNCTSIATGPTCRAFTCSYQRPCYPGDCVDSTTCTCTSGFTANNQADGCINFAKTETRLKPSFGESNVTISDIRRFDGQTNFMFVLDVGDVNSSIVWSNQKRFNNIKFEVKAVFDGIQNLPKRPVYVYDSQIGIVENIVTTNVSKIPRDGGQIRDPGVFKIYPCEGGYKKDNPTSVASCTVNDDQFKTLIEHGDWLNIEFRSLSGGFQKLLNIDQQSAELPNKYYNGLSVIKTVEFRFDFIAPKHCSEQLGQQNCGKMLEILHVFTRDPIRAQWRGWTDELSGVGEYFMEVFKLGLNRDGRLVETTPINPVFSATVAHSASGIAYPEYRPLEAGMYSVLLEVRDKSNNSRIARRFGLYDNSSSISLNTETAKLYVSSAVEETGYTWQTPAKTGQNVTVTVAWPNYFVNHLHEDNRLLAKIEQYPIQFKDIQDDGVLYSEKFVADALDGNEGSRTRAEIPNFHGIVKFEIFWQPTVDPKEPTTGWDVIPLKESFTIQRPLVDRDRLRVWVRATDIMGNQRADSTIIRVDGSKPLMQTDPSKTEQNLNIANGPYNYSSKVVFTSTDGDSGVYKIGFDIFVQTDPKNPLTQKMVYSNLTAGNIGSSGNAECRDVDGVCFLSSQTVFLDNCWMLVGKSEIDNAVAMVNVTAYNQAMLGTSATINLGPVKKLHGLEKYDGPQNPRIVNKTPTGFRITWDLPEKQSCYGRADIVIILSRKTATGEDVLHTYYTPGTSNHFDILGLNPETEYTLGLNIQTPGTPAQQTDFLTTKTEQEKEGVSTGALVGAIIGVLAVAAIAIVVVVVLSRKGIIHPVTQVRSIHRQVTQRVQRSRAGQEHFNFAYKNDSDDLYLYGGMNYAQAKVLSRDDVVLESLLKAGHFADIYMAKFRGQTVVAKTLKQHFSKRDEHVMKAKINFSSEKVGDHPHVLKYLGAVVDGALGPFIVYEYCENGTLKDFLLRKKSNLTIQVQEMLFRFGLDLAKGMEYLAGIKITHRRLAARNILLTFLNEIKISGFGPQPEEEAADGDVEGGKGERIPVKWMAPECMTSTKKANEKSDVWSFAVVLWEIFSLGENPYEKIRSNDILSQLKNNVRLPKPEQCDDVWYDVMKRCWAFEANKRPRFGEVRQQLESLFVAGPGDDYIYSKQ